MKLPNTSTRKRIVYRIDGGTSVVQASAIQSDEDLAFAVGFLLHHRLYKLSKSKAVTEETAQAVGNAVADALDTFYADVISNLGEGGANKAVISELGEGKIVNPFDYVSR